MIILSKIKVAKLDHFVLFNFRGSCAACFFLLSKTRHLKVENSTYTTFRLSSLRYLSTQVIYNFLVIFS